MALTQKLDMRQGQSLVMTPQLQQAIKLLQMSNYELQEYVEAELEKNPLLEKDSQKDFEAVTPVENETAATEDSSLSLPADGEMNKTLENMDTDLGNVYADEARADTQDRAQPAQIDSGWASVGTSSRSGSFEREGFNFENILADEKTLSESLTEQLHLSRATPAQQLIGLHLIGTLTETGYLASDVISVAEALGVSQREVDETLEILQTFEPIGVFARDLQDCLAIQLREKDRLDPVMQTLLANLDLLAKRDFPKLKKLCGVDLEDIYDMVAEIRELDPKPGQAFGDVVVQPVIPDVIVRPAPDGTWIVELNSETLPRVLVNNQYYATVSASAEREQDKVYISECHNEATWLVKSLEQRARTILSVSREIVRQQDAFLVSGISALKPLNLRDIADVIGMHESTVSRVTSNKYIETPRGVFELKYFFTTAISSTDGGSDFSAESIRHQIRNLIDSESADKVLSDDAIVDHLRGQGVDIARRTVAKYRESLHIPSSVQRRREKKAAI
jgi:RNA polymerase sigma-54 factor